MSRNVGISKRMRRESIREARAGLIPQSDDIIDEIQARLDRTSTITRVVSRYRVASESEEAAITNILVDLRHHCSAKGLSFGNLQTCATRLYGEEISSEAEYLSTLGLEKIKNREVRT
jgi:hypothetical protein